MQTFLPVASYLGSARALDNKRLGKQRVECKQILLALGVPIGPHKPGTSSWRNHPAVRMWRGYEPALLVYAFGMCYTWRRRGFTDNLGVEFERAFAKIAPRTIVPKPPWFGAAQVHASHRSNLLRKDQKFYGKLGWEEPDDLPYFWPV